MKRTLLLAAIAMITLPSCKKCWQCTLTMRTTPASAGIGNTSSSVQVCNMSAKQIRDYEKQNSTTATSSVQGYTATVTQTMSCQ